MKIQKIFIKSKKPSFLQESFVVNKEFVWSRRVRIFDSLT